MSKSRKISKEEKVTIVKRCLSGEFGVCEAGRQIGVNQQCVREWINRYEAEGEEGLSTAQGWRKYPKELKEAAVKDYLSGKGSMEDICKKYKIRSTHPLQNWIKVYNGHKELRNSTGGSRMTKGRKTTQAERIAVAKACIANGKNYGEIAIAYPGSSFTSRDGTPASFFPDESTEYGARQLYTIPRIHRRTSREIKRFGFAGNLCRHLPAGCCP